MSKNILINTAFGSFAEIALRISKLTFLSLIAKLTSTETFGLYVFSVAYISLFGVFFDFGLNPIYLRNSTKDSKEINNISFLMTKIITSLIGIISLVIISLITLEREKSFIVILMGIYTLSTEFYTFLLTSLKAQNKYKIESSIRSILSIVPLFVCLITLLSTSNFKLSILFLAILSVLENVICLIFINKFKFTNINSLKKNIKDIFLQALPIAITVFLGAFYNNYDIIFLGRITSLEEVALYSVVVKLTLAISIIPLPFLNNAVQTAFGSRKWDIDTSKKWIKGYYLSFSFGLVVYFLMNILGYPFIKLIFGISYLASYKYLLLFSIVGLLHYVYSPLWQLLIMNGKQTKLIIILTASMIFNFISLRILIPIYGSYGAIYSAIFTHFLIFLLHLYFSYKVLFKDVYFKKIISDIIISLFLIFSAATFLTFYGIEKPISIFSAIILFSSIAYYPIKKIINYSIKELFT